MAAAAEQTKTIVIQPADIGEAAIKIRGTAPYVQHKFSSTTKAGMLESQKAGARSGNRKKREARDIQADYEGAMHRMPDGSHGIPAPAFRSAMISACRLVGFQMTKAKLSVFVEPDGFDKYDGTPLVKLDGEPELHEANVRLESGVASIAIRPMWREWSAVVRVRFDRGQFNEEDVVNLLSRAGMQVGVGEGRPDSKKSHGMGWGLFEVVEYEERG